MLKDHPPSNPIDTELACGLRLVAPTARLPTIRNLLVTPLTDLRSCVDYLRVLYNPEVRGSKRRKGKELATTARASSNLSEDDVKERIRAIREDGLERAHAIRWLTSLVARGDDIINFEGEPSSPGPDNDGDGVEMAMRERLIEDAAALLAACAGTAGSGRVSRTYAFGPSPLGEEVNLTLTDVPLENGDYASVGAQTWGGACVMADMIFEDPERFDLPVRAGKIFDEENVFRILELGAGTGLVGMALAKLMQLRNIRSDVVLTDFYPSVLANLRSNASANFPSDSRDCVKVSVFPLDWSTYALQSRSENDIDLETFDLVVGADIVYESDHAVWIKSCLARLLRPQAHFHLVIPLRHTHAKESSTVEQVFGEDSPDHEFEIVHRERFSCDAHPDGDSRLVDRADEVEYAYYTIGWRRAGSAIGQTVNRPTSSCLLAT